tara:strand:+ start:126 stop:509 length:384 start_codon:yes stop_codon:yes gene_type:complete
MSEHAKKRNEGANWNTKYIATASGRCYKISEMSLKQTNTQIGRSKTNIYNGKVYLEQLYQRRRVLLELPYDKDKTKRKILEALNYDEKKNIPHERMQQIILLALSHLDQGADHSLIKAILEQARDDE